MRIHSCSNATLGYENPVFECDACEFIGTLTEAIEHIVKNQFEVKYNDVSRP